MSALSVTDEDCQAAWDAYLAAGKNATAACEALDMPRTTFRNRLKMAKERGFDEIPLHYKLSRDYDLNMKEKTAQEAWDEHATTFERTASKILSEQWRQIERKGPFVIFHSTDEHIDDNAAPLKLIEADIKAAHEMSSIMCHGGDALNNWRLAGRLAAEWARQQCTLPDALLRLEHFISIFKPDVWTDGNHEEMNPYLAEIIKKALPENVIRGDWTANFVVKTDGRPVRAIMSHKFQKGGSWFHPHQGFLRETLEGEAADVYMEGHLHISGWMYRTLPERGISALGVASSGYKILDKYATRISRGGRIAKIKGRSHWIVADPHCEDDGALLMPFDDPVQAEAYFGALQNLRAI